MSSIDGSGHGRESTSSTVVHDSHERPVFNQRTHSSPHAAAGKKGGKGEHDEYAAGEEPSGHQNASKSLEDAEAKLNNPLADYSAAELIEMGRKFAIEQDLADMTEMQRRVHSKRGLGKFGIGRKKRLANMKNSTPTGMKQAGDMGDASEAERRKHGETLWGKAALVAQNPLAFEGMEGLDEADREALRHEQTHSESGERACEMGTNLARFSLLRMVPTSGLVRDGRHVFDCGRCAGYGRECEYEARPCEIASMVKLALLRP